MTVVLLALLSSNLVGRTAAFDDMDMSWFEEYWQDAKQPEPVKETILPYPFLDRNDCFTITRGKTSLNDIVHMAAQSKSLSTTLEKELRRSVRSAGMKQDETKSEEDCDMKIKKEEGVLHEWLAPISDAFAWFSNAISNPDVLEEVVETYLQGPKTEGNESCESSEEYTSESSAPPPVEAPPVKMEAGLSFTGQPEGCAHFTVNTLGDGMIQIKAKYGILPELLVGTTEARVKQGGEVEFNKEPLEKVLGRFGVKGLSMKYVEKESKVEVVCEYFKYEDSVFDMKKVKKD